MVVRLVAVRHTEAEQSGPLLLAAALSVKPTQCDRPDGVQTFDMLSSVLLPDANHEGGQPIHLKVKDMACRWRPSELVAGAVRKKPFPS